MSDTDPLDLTLERAWVDDVGKLLRLPESLRLLRLRDATGSDAEQRDQLLALIRRAQDFVFALERERGTADAEAVRRAMPAQEEVGA
jgi:hypothetical protein